MCGDVSLDISECSGMDSVDRDVVTVPVHLGSQNQPGTVERETLRCVGPKGLFKLPNTFPRLCVVKKINKRKLKP